MFLGIDLGTSGIKTIVMDEQGQIVATESAPLAVSRPHDNWSEQHPEDWWTALQYTLDALSVEGYLKDIRSIGLSGQMHGAVCLDAAGEVIRPAILWNDGRSHAQCQQLETSVPECRNITGNQIMSGFTAPKLLWMKQHEPEAFARIHKVLLPKDYLRYRLSGDYASDMSDSAGTVWMDTAKRDWHDGLLNACGLTREQMPTLYEGNQITGQMHASLARHWGMAPVPIVAGGGDNAAGAIGVGIIHPGQTMLSLGTSGVIFSVSDGFCSNPESAVHSFCHALPDAWHLMSVHLSAASCLQWLAQQVVNQPLSTLLDEARLQAAAPSGGPLFLPYLSGERTPHNNPDARGVLFGLSHSTEVQDLVHAVLEGVGFAMADGIRALAQADSYPAEISVIGGGARSRYWRQMLANILNCPISLRQGGDVGPALGAARLAQLALTPHATIETICPVPADVETLYPNQQAHAQYMHRYQTFKALYASLRPLF